MVVASVQCLQRSFMHQHAQRENVRAEIQELRNTLPALSVTARFRLANMAGHKLSRPVSGAAKHLLQVGMYISAPPIACNEQRTSRNESCQKQNVCSIFTSSAVSSVVRRVKDASLQHICNEKVMKSTVCATSAHIKRVWKMMTLQTADNFVIRSALGMRLRTGPKGSRRNVPSRAERITT
jgi:hypothetical protein